MKIPRYLVNFELKDLPQETTDFLIIGSGAGGLFAGNLIPDKFKGIIITKGKIHCSNTKYAQGGIAISISEEDTWEKHLQDTILAGDGLVDKKSAAILTKNAKEILDILLSLGMKFDKDNGNFSLGWEAAHSCRRILHSKGDKTGEVLENILIKSIKTKGTIKIKEHCFCIDILTHNNECVGAIYFDEKDKKIKAILSKVTILASGGAGRLYKYTTNSRIATGDGIALAYRCGANLQDLEFFQFHPTALYVPQDKIYSSTRLFLISEAVRGEGAILKNINGESFMEKYSDARELAPRDIVSRAIFSEMKNTRANFVWLDLTEIGSKKTKERFPNIYRTLKMKGLDITRDKIPVIPAAHYFMGGVKTNTRGETNIKRLFAVGEVASTSVHGANRLASNSIIEALVFAKISVEEAKKYLVSFPKIPNIKHDRQKKIDKKIFIEGLSKKLREMMWENVGIIRDKEGLTKNKLFLQTLLPYTHFEKHNSSFFEFQNKIILSYLITSSAIKRKESRGAHYRRDYPNKDKNWKKHIIVKRNSIY